jgi:hypothetical protein
MGFSIKKLFLGWLVWQQGGTNKMRRSGANRRVKPLLPRRASRRRSTRVKQRIQFQRFRNPDRKRALWWHWSARISLGLVLGWMIFEASSAWHLME